MIILITNLHSARNLGDDAIMHATLLGLRQVYPKAQVIAAANDPVSWQKYADLEVIHSLCSWVGDCRLGRFRQGVLRMPLIAILLMIAALLYRLGHIRFLFGDPEQRRLLTAYYDADLVLSCGGGNFYAHCPLSPALFWGLAAVAFASALGKKTVLLPQSIGPIEGSLQRRFTRWVLYRVDRILVRESRSASFISDILKINREPVLLPDLAFGLPPPPWPPPFSAKMGVAGWGLQVGVTVIDRAAQDIHFRQQQAYEAILIELLERLCADYHAHIHLFTQCYGPSPDQDDRAASRRLYQALQDRHLPTTLHPDFFDALHLRNAYQSMNLMIGSRLHTGILALSCGIPTLLIGYQPKAIGMMELLGLGQYCFAIENLDTELLYTRVNQMIQQQEDLNSQVIERYTQAHHLVQGWRSYL